MTEVTKPVWTDALTHAKTSDLSIVTRAAAGFGKELAVMMWWSKGIGVARYNNPTVAAVQGVCERTVTTNAGILIRAGFLRVQNEVVNGNVQRNYFATLPDNHKELSKDYKTFVKVANNASRRSSYDPSDSVSAKTVKEFKEIQGETPTSENSPVTPVESATPTEVPTEPVIAPEPVYEVDKGTVEVNPPKPVKEPESLERILNGINLERALPYFNDLGLNGDWDLRSEAIELMRDCTFEPDLLNLKDRARAAADSVKADIKPDQQESESDGFTALAGW